MKSRTGLTLVELCIGIVLLGLVVLAGVAINASSNRFLASENSQSRLANQVSYAVELIVRDIMQSFGDPPGSGALRDAFYIFDKFGADAPIGFELVLHREDLPPSGVDPNDRWVGYRWNNNQIEFTNNRYPNPPAPPVWVILIGNIVDAPIFEAVDLNADGNAFNDQFIRIEITCRQNPSQPPSALNQEVTLVSAARIPAASSQ
ncbi:MAG: prepilin-type N-terminal cleavage/methylation domain-containing protein [Candidatus Omnitrophota bacterium]